MTRKSSIPERLRRQVQERARGCCEYCLIHESDMYYFATIMPDGSPHMTQTWIDKPGQAHWLIFPTRKPGRGWKQHPHSRFLSRLVE